MLVVATLTEREKSNKTLDRLVSVVAKTNLIALDKTLAAIGCAPRNYSTATTNVQNIARCIARALVEVRALLPPTKPAA